MTNPTSPSGLAALHRRPLALSSLILSLVLAVAASVACASSPVAVEAPAAGAEAAAAPPEAVATAATADATTPAAAEAEDDVEEGAEEVEVREWMVDEKGREFYVREVQREPGYSVRPDNKIMLPPGAAYDIYELRDDVVLVKIYNPETIPDLDITPEAPRGEPLADVADLAVREVDRLRFGRIGAGLPNRQQWRQGFEMVDMNGDGHLDIVHGPARKGDPRPKIFLGDGAGDWRLWREARYESEPLDYGDVAVADFDADGHLDLALGVHLRGVMILRGDGAGRFTQWGEGLSYWAPGSADGPPPYSTRTIEAVDWNRDGRMDLLTVGEGPRLMGQPARGTAPSINRGDRGPVLFLNRGEGKFERFDQGTGRRRIFGDGLAVGDFDGDGIEDFAIASRVGKATTLVKMGAEDGSWEDISLGELARPGIYGAVHAADLDQDEREELLLAYSARDAERERWTGVDLLDHRDGAWHRTALFAEKVDHDAVTALTTGDLDGDGVTDMVALTDSGQRWIFLGTEGGGLVRETSDELASREISCQGYSAEIVALDGVGPVLLMGFAGEQGSEQIVIGATARCPSGGSLEAWTPAPAP